MIVGAMSQTQTLIAGKKTADDWRAFRNVLHGSADHGLWDKAYRDYFYVRLESRYFKPIQLLQQYGTLQGEGFSIVAIQCSLVEFLESTIQGSSYRFLQNGQKLGPHEYSSSSVIFVNFLCNRNPFKSEFDKTLAMEFYVSVRCALLHEARTKGDWTISAKRAGGIVIDRVNHIVYRDNFQRALKTFISDYGESLKSDRKLQEAFIRKFDTLCL